MPKDSIKDKIDGNECDFSLSNLTVVPVRELMPFTKITSLDLSCNLLTEITEEFCQLKQLVKLDLSKNEIETLPEGIGALEKLQHFDLFSNKLPTLPVGFSQLKNLRWLDLKDNPLSDPLRKTAGDCLDPAQCKKCAKNIVAYMVEVDLQNQKKAQKRQMKKQAKEAAIKAEQERLNKERKEKKKLEKEKKRQEYEAKFAKEAEEKEPEGDAEESDDSKSNGFTAMPITNKRAGVGCCGVLLAIFVGAVALLIGLYFYCQSNESDQFCMRASFQVLKLKYYLHKFLETYVNN